MALNTSARELIRSSALGGPAAAPRPDLARPGRDGDRRVSLLVGFLLSSFVSVSVVSMTSAYLLSRFVTRSMLTQDLHEATEFINNVFGVDGADRHFTVDGKRSPELVNFFTRVSRLPEVLRANIYLPDGTVLW